MAPSNAGMPVSIEMIRRLVAFPTVSRDSNLELIHYARDYLQDLGAELRLTYDDERRPERNGRVDQDRGPGVPL